MTTDLYNMSLFGGGFDTGNMGVSALTRSYIDSVQSRVAQTQMHIYDHGRGSRHDAGVRYHGARWSRCIHQNDSIHNIQFALLVRGSWNPAAQSIRNADAIFDISGGDSFTDLYGMWRYGYVVLPKQIALRYRKPLFLLPQTYGPFRSRKAHSIAQRIVRSAAMAWARDERSFMVLKELLGDAFDPRKHRCGVDLAFLLDSREPPRQSQELLGWLDADGPVAGLNISGLIYNQPERAREQYGLALDYREAVHALALRVLETPEARLLLVPHVAPARGDSPEDDARACAAAREALPAGLRERVLVGPVFDDPRCAKWLIRRCDWFCGTRMHSTIASLSTGVPTATLAYSGKAQGVFETCGQGEYVADMRSLSTEEAVGLVAHCWMKREMIGASLRESIPGVLERAEEQMDEIVAAATGREAEAFAKARRERSVEAPLA